MKNKSENISAADILKQLNSDMNRAKKSALLEKLDDPKVLLEVAVLMLENESIRIRDDEIVKKNK